MSFSKPWHTPHIHHPRMFIIYGGMPNLILNLFTLHFDSLPSLQWESWIFIVIFFDNYQHQGTNHVWVTRADYKRMMWIPEEDVQVINSAGPSVYLKAVNTVTYSDMWFIHWAGSRLGVVRKALWGDGGRIKSRFPSASKSKTVHASCLTSEVSAIRVHLKLSTCGASPRVSAYMHSSERM